MRMTLYDYCAERDELVLLTQWAPVKNRTLTPREGSYGRRQKNWRTYWPERWPPSGASPDLTPEHVTAGISGRPPFIPGRGRRSAAVPVCAGKVSPKRLERCRRTLEEWE